MSDPQTPRTAAPGFAHVARSGPTPTGGIFRFVGLTLLGVGLIMTGLSLGYLIDLINGTSTNYTAMDTNFFRTVEIAAVIAGVGVLFLGLAAYFDSR